MAAFNRARLTSTQGTQLNPVRAQPMHSLSCSSSRCLSVRATAQIQQNSDGQRSTPLADASSKLVSGLTAGIIALIVTGEYMIYDTIM